MTHLREAIAYHEAGHAVISMKLGYKCLYVTIVPDGDRLGHVCCKDPLVGGHDDKIKHALKVLIAAGLAESKHIGSQTWGDADDRVKAMNLALLATNRNAERAKALINDMIGEARKLMEQYWPDIDKLAKQRSMKAGSTFCSAKPRLQKAPTPGHKEGCAGRKMPQRLRGVVKGHHQRSRTPKNVWSERPSLDGSRVPIGLAALRR